MPSIRVCIGDADGLVYDLHKPLTSIGSGTTCDVVLDDALIPAIFANIQFDGHGYSIAVLDKSIDLSVNGKKRRKHKLSHGDKLVIGVANLRFDMVSEEPRRKTKPADSNVVGDIDAYKRLNDFSARLMRAESVPILLEELMDAVVEITQADKGFLVLLEGQTPTVKVARNCNQDNIADAVSQLSDSIISRVFEKKEPVIVSDAVGNNMYATSISVTQLKLTSVICVPLLERGSMFGLLYVGKDTSIHLFDETTMNALSVFASQAALILRTAMLLNQLRNDNEKLSSSMETMRFGKIIGSSAIMQSVYQTVEKVASTDASVLIAGDTGTGKELIAKEIHLRSKRSKGPFIAINCGAIPEQLLESELFGHVRGAFTGAVATKDGSFQAANKGTLFLDEIGEMPFALQAKILRALQERSVSRVGAPSSEPVDIRIISATNRDLDKEITDGRFREDLFYRLNVIQVQLPALRERGDDVITIGRYFLARAQEELGIGIKGFTPDGEAALRRHSWPGNIRELENRIKKATVLATSPLISAADLGLDDPEFAPLTLADAKENFQRDYINKVLSQNAGNRTKTAKELGVDPRTIFRHLERMEAQNG